MRRFFEWVENGSDLYADVEAARTALNGRADLRTAVARAEELHCELRAEPCATGWRVTRLYVVAQWREPGFRSLGYLAEPHGTRVLGPADDPRLPQLRDAAAPWRSADAVLRYVPLRRLTFRTGPWVGKAKRVTKLADSHARLVAVRAIADHADTPFRAPEPGRLDGAAGVFWQEWLPGRPVAGTWGSDGLLEGLAAVGAVHARVHATPLRADSALPRQTVHAPTAGWESQLAWIASALPFLRADLTAADHWLRSHQADLATSRSALCHGDFACSQVVATDDGPAVVDWDLAVVGNPIAEVATTLAGLPGDVDQLTDAPAAVLAEAERAYLAGYECVDAQRLDPRALRAWRLVAEVAELAKRLTKDRLDPAALQRARRALRLDPEPAVP